MMLEANSWQETRTALHVLLRDIQSCRGDPEHPERAAYETETGGPAVPAGYTKYGIRSHSRMATPGLGLDFGISAFYSINYLD